MKTIYKYPIQIEDYLNIEMPKDAQILSIQTQNGELQMWALVDNKSPLVERKFKLVGTGHPIGEDLSTLSYLGTFQLLNYRIVFHLFEIIK